MVKSRKQDRHNNPQNQTASIPPCRQLELSAPLKWLKAGCKDFLSAPVISLSYGFTMSLIVLCIVWSVWRVDSAWVLISLFCALIFISPLLFVCTYAVSALLQRKQRVKFVRTLRAGFSRYLGNELVFILVLIVFFLVWARALSMISIFIPANSNHSILELAPYLTVVTFVGILFICVGFSISVFSLPMIMDRDTDAVTAVIASINAVLRNKLTLLFWLMMIVLLCAIGLMTFGILLIVILPVIGYAVWHGYLDTIDASGMKRHTVGITATTIPDNA